MRVVACLLLVGCGRIGFGIASDPGAGGDAAHPGDGVGDPQGAGDAGPCTSLSQLTYNFDGSADALWMPYQDPGLTVTETGNHLVITLASNMTGTAGYFSSCTYDLHGQRVFVTSPVVPRLGTRTDMYFAVGSQADAFGVNVTSGSTEAYRINGANYMRFASVPYDATQHKVWQVREAGGTVFWEVSPDGTSFTTLFSGPPPIDISAVQLLLFADALTPISNPGSAEFAKLNLP